jgi:hypothetical protein
VARHGGDCAAAFLAPSPLQGEFSTGVRVER